MVPSTMHKSTDIVMKTVARHQLVAEGNDRWVKPLIDRYQEQQQRNDRQMLTVVDAGPAGRVVSDEDSRR